MTTSGIEDKPIRRADYKPPEYLVDHVHLVINIINKTRVEVSSTLDMRSNPEAEGESESAVSAVVLNVGKEIKQIGSVSIDGVQLEALEYSFNGSTLTFPGRNGRFQIRVGTIINPLENTQRRGLYNSEGVLLTQMESEGFRNLTPFPDRPDVLSTWITEVTADKETHPTLLATGDKIEEKDNGDDTHSAKFESKLPMPSYLYALVAGKLECTEEEFETDGRKIKLQIFTEAGDKERVKVGMEALKMAIKWDKENYGRNYPLKEYRIVVAKDFNSGAMENFGLNIFNASNFLVDPEITTDDDTIKAAMTVAHEYDHTWRGDMVTVRTWHEPALKEGFVKLMDSLFEESLLGKTIGRIRSARILRTKQFPEDAGSSAHAIWPDEYKGDPGDSLYTATTYLKGAEVIRMAKTILGEEKFRLGSDLYFDRFYGKAATIDDLVSCMQEASGADLSQLKQWFTQVGTPECNVQSCHNEAAGLLALTVKQSCPKEPKYTLQIPMAIGLVGPDGKSVPLELENDNGRHDLARGIINVTEGEQTFVFKNVPKGTVPSLFRHFSAPVKFNYLYTTEDLVHLINHDEDGFNKYEAGQRIARDELDRLMNQYKAGEEMAVDEKTLVAYDRFTTRLMDDDPSLFVEMLTLPDEKELVQGMEIYNFQAAKSARDVLRRAIAERYERQFVDLYKKYDALSAQTGQPGSPAIDVKAIEIRKIKNFSLTYLGLLGDKHAVLAENQYKNANNMTDRLAALRILADRPGQGEAALADFYEKYKHEELAVQKWLNLQGLANRDDLAERLSILINNEQLFDCSKPANMFPLFTFGLFLNPALFHKEDGSGYKLIADVVIKSKNPYAATRVLKAAYSDFPRMDATRRELIKEQLQRLIDDECVADSAKTAAKKILGQ